MTEKQFKWMLSKEAEGSLEEMAQEARTITLKNFGKTIQLYTPLYLSNYCENACVYCGFNTGNPIERRRLSLDEVEKEAAAIAQTGLKHVLVLTGESREKTPVSYIKDCVKILRKDFTSISVEIYALTGPEYRELVEAGVDGLTIYQETYNEGLYRSVHPSGLKSDYGFRLDAPARGARAGMRSVNLGILLGLGDWREDAFSLGLHAGKLQDEYPGVEIGVSLPRMRPHAGSFKVPREVDDRAMVQMITALRIFLPRAGISISTREEASFRDNLIKLGVTRISAGSSTYVGGRSAAIKQSGEEPQFEISDTRSVSEIVEALKAKGYQPVLKDWVTI